MFRFKPIQLIAAIGFAITLPSVASAESPFTQAKVVFIGDSLTSGFQNGSQIGEFQNKGYAAVIARQAGFSMTQAEITAPGLPPHLELKSVSPLKIDPVCELPSTDTPSGDGICLALPDRSNKGTQITNLAVPGHKLHDVLYTRPFTPASNTVTDVILGFPGALMEPPQLQSQVEMAEQLQPDAIIVWIGANDALGFATSGGTEPLTDPEQFEEDYNALLCRLRATGAMILCANVPNITVIPFLLTATEFAELVLGEGADLEQIPFLTEDDFVRLDGVDTLIALLQGEDVSAEELDEAVLTAAEAREAKKAVKAYNRIIKRVARRYRVPVVNMYKVMKLVNHWGVPVGDHTLTTDFMGGLFSLDGVHPTDTGYAIMANVFINKINRKLGCDIPRADLAEIMASDPLILPRPKGELTKGGIHRGAIRRIKQLLLCHW